METVFMERTFDRKLAEDDLRTMVLNGADCASLYRVDWIESFLSEDGQRMTCCFNAPDTEAVRTLSRDAEAVSKHIYPATAHDTARNQTANVVVERSFEEPVTVEALQAIEDEGAWCLETHKVTFLRTYFSKDQKHMICIYNAPDAESVRLAQQQAGMPMDRVWAARVYTQERLFE